MTGACDMPRLGLDMAARYDIEIRPALPVRAAVFGTDALMLDLCRHLEDQGVGAVCFAPGAGALAVQDGLFTVMERDENGTRERVVESISLVLDPSRETDALETEAAEDIARVYLHDDAGTTERLLLAALLRALEKAGKPVPEVFLVGELPEPGCADALRAAFPGVGFHPLMLEGLRGAPDEAEAGTLRRRMNYIDDYLIWAQPKAAVFTDEDGADYGDTFRRHARIGGALRLIGTAAGFLSGKNSFSEVMRDEKLRAFIGRAFSQEVLPFLPWPRMEIAPEVISAFERLGDSANALKLNEAGRYALARMRHTVRDALTAYCAENFEPPPFLTLALAATVMLYAGARMEDGAYCVLRDQERLVLEDDAELLEGFSRLAHDMPAESLSYAVVADYALWGCDLREADGLEARLADDLSSIQRNGFADTLRRRMEEQA